MLTTPDIFSENKLERRVFSVSELNGQVRELLETGFPPIWLEGEISNLRRPASGHLYFSLKDAGAQVRCALFRGRYLKNLNLQDGTHVLVQAKISLYEERGDYQLIIDQIEEAGGGALRRAFEQLKQRLADEGLFRFESKKLLPLFPQTIGVVTSSSGAAVRDILHVLKRRCPNLAVVIYPTLVQGGDAAPQIAAAIKTANIRKECDVLIVARGGGSLEDLWPFNEEMVARAIFASDIPIVSGIGHEIDFTIADFVADQRAPTPSAAAELVSPNQQELLHQLLQSRSRLRKMMLVQLRQLHDNYFYLEKRLQQPQKKIHDYAQHLDYQERTLNHSWHYLLQQKTANLQKLSSRLQAEQPQQRLQQFQMQQSYLSQQLIAAIKKKVQQEQQQLAQLARALDAISPLNTLQRGYALTFQEKTLVSRVVQIKKGAALKIKLYDGQIDCVVEKVIPDNAVAKE